jgi:hypothetical protein
MMGLHGPVGVRSSWVHHDDRTPDPSIMKFKLEEVFYQSPLYSAVLHIT